MPRPGRIKPSMCLVRRTHQRHHSTVLPPKLTTPLHPSVTLRSRVVCFPRLSPAAHHFLDASATPIRARLACLPAPFRKWLLAVPARLQSRAHKPERDPLKSAKTTSLSSHASDPLLSYPTVRCSISCLTDGAPLGLLGRPNIRDDAYVYLLVGNCKFPGANNRCFGAGLTFLARAANVVRRRSRIDEGRASGSGFCLCSPSICKLVPKYI